MARSSHAPQAFASFPYVVGGDATGRPVAARGTLGAAAQSRPASLGHTLAPGDVAAHAPIGVVVPRRLQFLAIQQGQMAMIDFTPAPRHSNTGRLSFLPRDAARGEIRFTLDPVSLKARPNEPDERVDHDEAREDTARDPYKAEICSHDRRHDNGRSGQDDQHGQPKPQRLSRRSGRRRGRDIATVEHGRASDGPVPICRAKAGSCGRTWPNLMPFEGEAEEVLTPPFNFTAIAAQGCVERLLFRNHHPRCLEIRTIAYEPHRH